MNNDKIKLHKNKTNKKKKNINYIPGLVIVSFLLFLFIKLFIYDCIIGTKIYNKNKIIIRYHRYVNIVTVKNNSDDSIYMHYQTGQCQYSSNEDRTCSDIEYYKKSDDFKIEIDEKFVKFTGFLGDSYIFTISNEIDLYDSISYNKNNIFN